MDNVLSDRVYHFGAFAFFSPQQVLLHAGAPVSAGSRALALLEVLLERAGKLVSKEELTRAVWPDTFVHEGNLKVNIASLRRTLASREPRQDYIATVPGRGYRFVGPVRLELAPRVTYTSAAPRVSLPAGIALIGRVAEVDAVQAAVNAHRVVTLCGTGGVGKTAVGVSAAHRLSERFEHGACFIDLAAITDTQHLSATIASELGIRSDSEDMLAAVIHVLRDQHKLILLDNCEHLLPAVAAAAERLVSALPGLHILATSREPLRLASERVLRIDPLAFPAESSAERDPRLARSYPAVELFLQRAAQASGADADTGDLLAVARICARLDGLPLAIELAAARCATHGTAALLRSLEARADLVEGGSGRPDRQRALRATLAWSYALLRPQEAAVLRALAVYARSFTVEDALVLAPAVEVAPSDALESTASLVSKSLLAQETSAASLRYRLLESTRAFASDLLEKDARCNRIKRAHAEHVCVVLERARDAWEQDTDAAVSRHGWLVADVRRALLWCFGSREAVLLGVELTLFAVPMWEKLTLLDESIAHLSTALRAMDIVDAAGATNQVRLRIALATALLYARGLTAETEAAWKQALELSEKAADVQLLMRALWGCAAYDLHAGRPALTAEKMHRFAELCRSTTDPFSGPDGERLLAAAEMYLGRLSSAMERLERVRAQKLASGPWTRPPRYQVDRDTAAGGTMALLTWLSGDATGAAALAEATARRAIASGHSVSICNVLVLGAVPIALLDGRLGDAARYMAIIREQFRGQRMTLWAQMARCPEAALAVRQGAPDGAAMLEEAIATLVAAGATIRVPFYEGLLAEAQASEARLRDAEGTIASALERASVQQENWIVPELMRIQAAIWKRQGQREASAERLREASERARVTGAEAWRARAAADLACFASSTSDVAES